MSRHAEFVPIAAHIGVATAPWEDGLEHPPLRPPQLDTGTLGAFRDELGCAADVAASWDIEVTSDSGWFFSWIAWAQAAEAR